MTVLSPAISAPDNLDFSTAPSQSKIALGTHLKEDLECMGANFYAVYPIAETHRFGYPLTAIDVADEEMRAARASSVADR